MEPQKPTEATFDMLLLIGHGSPDPAGNEEYLSFARLLSEQLDITVQPCFLELAEPSIAEGMRRCAEQGAQRVAVLPLFLGAAGHQKNDVPALLREHQAAYPQVTFTYGTPIGAQSPVVAALAERAAAAVDSSNSGISLADTALLVVGRGSSDPDSNSEVFKVGRLLWEGRDYGWVDVAFQTVTRPQVGEALHRCALSGARRVVVLPYLLFTGVVCNDIGQQARAAARQHPQLEVLVGQHLANHSGVVAAVAQRYRDMVEGTATMTCDVCKYRHKMTGFEHDHNRPQETHHHGHGHGHHHHAGHGHSHSHGHHHEGHGHGHAHHHHAGHGPGAVHTYHYHHVSYHHVDEQGRHHVHHYHSEGDGPVHHHHHHHGPGHEDDTGK
jgi:sirohydrochlorin cobaltochelatase